MNETILKRLSNLLSPKSIMTILLSIVFSYLSITHYITAEQFTTIFLMVASFYFGTQTQKLENAVEKAGNK